MACHYRAAPPILACLRLQLVFSNTGMSLDEAGKGSTQWVDRWLGK